MRLFHVASYHSWFTASETLRWTNVACAMFLSAYEQNTEIALLLILEASQ